MKIFALSLLIILLPVYAFSAPPAFSDYEVVSNWSHQGKCDAEQTDIKIYQNQTYFLRVITTKNNSVYYVFSKDQNDPYHFFIKNPEATITELSEEKWLENLTVEGPNAVKRQLREQNDCSVKRVKESDK